MKAGGSKRHRKRCYYDYFITGDRYAADRAAEAAAQAAQQAMQQQAVERAAKKAAKQQAAAAKARK